MLGINPLARLINILTRLGLDILRNGTMKVRSGTILDAGLNLPVLENRYFDVEVFSRLERKSFSEVRDDLRLKQAIKRAIAQDFAPRYLEVSIRDMLRE